MVREQEEREGGPEMVRPVSTLGQGSLTNSGTISHFSCLFFRFVGQDEDTL